MKPTFSLLANHAPFGPQARKDTLRRMLVELTPLARGLPFWLHDTDYRNGGAADLEQPGNPKPRNVDFTIAQWRWAAAQDTTHHLFVTDDLELAPMFIDVLEAMAAAVPDGIIGLLSNHPSAPALAGERRWYCTNSWVVGPCYVVPHRHMLAALAWAERAGAKDHGWSDDATLNEWITFHGPGRAYHPIPTPIEHLRVLPSTWAHTGHGDEYSHERVSWRGARVEPWTMTSYAYWNELGGPEAAPMLKVGGGA